MQYRLVFCIFLFCTILAFPQKPVSVAEFSKGIQSYFVDPNFEDLKELARDFKQIPDFNDVSNQPGPMGFFSVAFNHVQDTVALKEFINSECTGNALLMKAYEMSSSQEAIVNISGHDPSLNDFFWGCFFASGSKDFVRRITFELEIIGERDSLALYLSAASAKWSLCANANKYAIVKQYLNEIKTHSTAIIRDEIEKLLAATPKAIKDEIIAVVEEIQKKKQAKN